MADDEEAVVLACTSLVFCALDLHQSQEQLLEKVRWTCPPPVHAVATPLSTCHASRARRDERVAPSCPTSTTQHVTTFSTKMHGLYSVSCRVGDVTQQVEFGL